MTWLPVLVSIAFAGGVFAASTAHAQTMTEDTIKTFLDETQAITEQDNGKSDEEIRAFLEEHLNEKGIFRSTVTYRAPDTEPGTQKMTMTREQYIGNVLQGRLALTEYSSTTALQNVELRDGGKSAKIQTQTREKGSMPMPEAPQPVPFIGVSDCTQFLEFNESQTIRIFSIECVTTTEFMPF